MTKQELLYKLTGTETPKFINEREDVIIDKCLALINEREEQLVIDDVSLSSCCKGTGLSKDEYGDEIYCSCEIGSNLSKQLYED